MIYVLLPAYNEGPNIAPLLEALAEEFYRWQAGRAGGGTPHLEAVVVDDGSADDTAEQARAFKGEIGVTVLQHEVNRGLAAALQTGISYILEQGDDSAYMASLDADGTHHPRYIFRMMDTIEPDYDILIASRFAPGGKEFGVNGIRRILSMGARLVYKAVWPDMPIRDFSCGFRLFRLSVIRAVSEQWGERLFEAPGFACTGELMLKSLAHTTPERVTEVPFELHYEKKGGESKMPAFTTILGTFQLVMRSRNWRRSSGDSL